MAKSVNLAVHKNTIEGRAKRRMATEVRGKVERIIRDGDIRAYAFVAIGADGTAHAIWDTGGVIPMYGFPETVSSIIDADMRSSGRLEDFKAPMHGGIFARRKSE